jgi:hypothetical protein
VAEPGRTVKGPRLDRAREVTELADGANDLNRAAVMDG